LLLLSAAMASHGGSKRAHTVEGKENYPRKRPATEEDDGLIDEAFAMDLEGEEYAIEEDPRDLEVEEALLGEAGKNWQRPTPRELHPATDSLGEEVQLRRSACTCLSSGVTCTLPQGHVALQG
jgi:hypothetical protein